MNDSERVFDFDTLQVPDELGSFEYVLTQEQLDQYRRAVDDPEAVFPTLAVKHDVQALSFTYHRAGVNAANEVEFLNPPVVGKRITVRARILDKFIRREQPYLLLEAEATDEDGRPIERIKTQLLLRTQRVGEKWSQE
jgi:hypothetical protein